MDPRLDQRLKSVGNRLRLFRLGWSLAATWGMLSVGGAVLVVLDQAGSIERQQALLTFGGACFITTLLVAICSAFVGSKQKIATKIENRFPNLKQSLITATEVSSKSPPEKLGYLQRGVVTEALRHDSLSPWKSIVPSENMSLAWLANIPSVIAIGFVAFLLVKIGQNQPQTTNPSSVENNANEFVVDVEPGNIQIERGMDLIVTATFPGAIPDGVTLLTKPVNQPDQEESPTTMARNLEDPVFAAYLNRIGEDTEYRVSHEGGYSETFLVEVFEFPSLLQADAKIEYPSYMNKEPKLVQNTRRISVPARSTIQWNLQLNKPVVSATLISDDDSEQFELENSADQPDLYSTRILMTESKNWTLQLVDSEERQNKLTFLDVWILSKYYPKNILL